MTRKPGPSSSSECAAAEEEAELHDHRGDRGEERGDRHDHHVAVLDVRELVRHDALELGGGEQLHDPRRRADRRALLRLADREGVGHVGVGDGDLRLGQIGLDAEALDHRVQLRRLLRRDLARAHRVQRELVGGEELHRREPARDEQDHEALDAGCEQHADERDVQRTQEEHREQHAGLQSRVACERRLRGSHGSILANRVQPACPDRGAGSVRRRFPCRTRGTRPPAAACARSLARLHNPRCRFGSLCSTNLDSAVACAFAFF